MSNGPRPSAESSLCHDVNRPAELALAMLEAVRSYCRPGPAEYPNADEIGQEIDAALGLVRVAVVERAGALLPSLDRCATSLRECVALVRNTHYDLWSPGNPDHVRSAERQLHRDGYDSQAEVFEDRNRDYLRQIAAAVGQAVTVYMDEIADTLAAMSAAEKPATRRVRCDSGTRTVPPPPPVAEVPVYDPALRQLSFKGWEAVVTRQAVGAQRILAAFNDAGWPRRINDPFGDGNQKLRAAVTTMRRTGILSNEARTIDLSPDGTGTGAVWSER